MYNQLYKIFLVMLLAFGNQAFGVGAKVIGQTSIPGVHIIQADDETLTDLLKASSAAQTILNISVDGGEGPNSLGEAYIGHNKSAATKKAMLINDDGNVLFNQAEGTAGQAFKGFSTGAATVIFRVENSSGTDAFAVYGDTDIITAGGRMEISDKGVSTNPLIMATAGNQLMFGSGGIANWAALKTDGDFEILVDDSGDCGIGNVCSGTYVPVASALSGFSSVNGLTGQWHRVGNTVTVAVHFTADPITAGTQGFFTLSIPISTTLDATEVAGSCIRFTSVDGMDPGIIWQPGSAANVRCDMGDFNNADAQSGLAHFTYLID